VFEPFPFRILPLISTLYLSLRGYRQPRLVKYWAISDLRIDSVCPRNSSHKVSIKAAVSRTLLRLVRWKAVVTTTMQLQFDRRSTPIRLQFHRATTIRRHSLRPLALRP